MNAEQRKADVMIHDEFTRFADGLWNEAAMSDNRDIHPMFTTGALIRELVKRKVAEEREACAQVADSTAARHRHALRICERAGASTALDHGGIYAADNIAAAIRARS